MNNPSKNVSKVLNRVEQVAQTLIPANYYFIDLIQTYSRDFPVKKAKTITKSHGDGLQIILTEQLAIWDTISSKLQSLISKYLELYVSIALRLKITLLRNSATWTELRKFNSSKYPLVNQYLVWSLLFIKVSLKVLM